MILGMSTFTFVHVLLSLIGIVSGLVALFGLIAANRLDGWTALFLVTTVATSVTGFGFPFVRFMPSHAIGILSLLILAVTIPARYNFHLKRNWRWIYVVGATAALYLNVFVLIVQAFVKIPSLSALAPTQSEPPFLFTQLAVLLLFILLGLAAVIRFKGPTLSAA
jgi:hypothetical protein